jgi:mRNA interferase MazF
MKRGDVVIVDDPDRDATGRKVRPALIVQSDENNKFLDDTIIALITSQLRRSLDTHVVIGLATPEGKQSGLRLASAVQCENLLHDRPKTRPEGHWIGLRRHDAEGR